MTTRVAILIPAAGTASRMRGGDKLLEPVDGAPQLARAAAAALATGCPVIVTLRPEDRARREALQGLSVETVETPDAAEGMAASLRRGAALCPPGHGLMVLPADMPEIGTGDLDAVISAFRSAAGKRIARGAAADGSPGMPVLFPARLVAAFSSLTGDEGARRLIREEEAVVSVPLPGRRALIDLDTPEEWAAWRAAHNHVR